MIKINSTYIMSLSKNLDLDDEIDNNDTDNYITPNKNLDYIITPEHKIVKNILSKKERKKKSSTLIDNPIDKHTQDRFDTIGIDTKDIQNFVEQYKEYKNNFGKISPYNYICQHYSDKLSEFLENHYSTNKEPLIHFIKDKINEIQLKARELNISNTIFDYLSEAQIKKILYIISRKRTVGKAIEYLYQACLYGDGLDIKFSKGRKRS